MNNLILTKTGLEEAIRDGSIIPVIQSFICCQSRRIIGAEVLARWSDYNGANIPPDVFIPEIIRNGLEVKLTLSLMSNIRESVLPKLKHKGREFFIGFNTSPECLKSTTLHSACRDFLSNLDDKNVRLALEITENQPITTALIPSIQKLKQLGVKIILDDFGSGYATPEILGVIPLDIVKIDRGLTALAGKNDPDFRLERSIRKIRAYKGIEILAEGVENEAEYSWMKRHGVKVFQGYFFSRPLACEKFLRVYNQGMDE